MTNGNEERRTFDPLDRTTFDAIAYNAVGRASEINTFPALSLTHSSGNSGWSVGIVQWDFGQPGRGEKVHELMSGYQQWARPELRFTPAEVNDLTRRLQTRGQAGNALTGAEQSRLDEYLRSYPGRELVSSLNQEQIDTKWQNVGEPLSRIEWLRDLRQADPAQATEIVAQAMKLYNQNELRGDAPDHTDGFRTGPQRPGNGPNPDQAQVQDQPKSLLDRLYEAAVNKDDKAMDAALLEYGQSPVGQQFQREIAGEERLWLAEVRQAELQAQLAEQQRTAQQRERSGPVMSM